MEPWIETATGQKFWFDGRDNQIFIDDISLALSKLCRFTGHCKFFYSVAEHSVNVSFLVPREQALAALLHDASEAYLADIASPVKQLLPDYKALESKVTSQIDKFFGVDTSTPEIKKADWAQLKAESRVLLASRGIDWYFPPDTAVGLWPTGLLPEEADRLFISRFKELLNDRKEEAQAA
jgi:uncharacterized protein